jgi:hypothetical protein
MKNTTTLGKVAEKVEELCCVAPDVPFPPFEKGGPGGISRAARPTQRRNSVPALLLHASGSVATEEEHLRRPARQALPAGTTPRRARAHRP